jgi:hypothetical protein
LYTLSLFSSFFLLLFTAWRGEANVGEAAALKTLLAQAFADALGAVKRQFGRKWSDWTDIGRRRLEKKAASASTKVADALRALLDDELTSASVSRACVSTWRHPRVGRKRKPLAKTGPSPRRSSSKQKNRSRIDKPCRNGLNDLRPRSAELRPYSLAQQTCERLRRPFPVARKTHMKHTANARFAIKSWDEKPYSEGQDLPKLTRASVAKTYTGEITGEGQVEYIMMYRSDGSATFLGLERVVGRIAGKTGSFVLQRIGVFEGGQAKESYSVIPGSATGELHGLLGEGRSAVGHGMEHPFTLDYELA